MFQYIDTSWGELNQNMEYTSLEAMNVLSLDISRRDTANIIDTKALNTSCMSKSLFSQIF